MLNLPLWVQALILFLLLLFAAFFSVAETSMMAANRYRLKHLANEGNRSARRVLELLTRSDQVLGTVLLGNTFLNTYITTLVAALTTAAFKDSAEALTIATALVAFAILVFSELTPKILGATYPDRLALATCWLLAMFMRVLYPAFWFVNLFVVALLKTFRISTKNGNEGQRLELAELRTLVLEAGSFIQNQHKRLLVNLLDLEEIVVEDVMTPRTKIEALDLNLSIDKIREILTTSFHNKLPVYEGDINQIVGVLHVRKLLGLLQDDDFDSEAIRRHVVAPYFIPLGTPVFQQLKFFQENRQRQGLVVDEYGEIHGLVTMEDILEEVVGEFTTGLPSSQQRLRWNEQNEILVEGSSLLRSLNRQLQLDFPLDQYKTLNGLILDCLQDIPEPGVCFKIGQCAVEIVQVEEKSIKMAKLIRIQGN